MAAKSAAGLLTSVDSMFTTQEERDNAQRSYVIDLPTTEISDFPDHPFKVRMDEEMEQMVESVRERGVLSPVLVRPMPDGGYQMVSGHRRKFASELAELPTVPCIVRELTDDEAIIIMVDSNLQRERVLPSEKAFAYKMKLDAMRRQQGERTDLTSVPPGQKLGKTSRELLADNSPDSNTQIQRYIRLTNLVPELLDMVDNSVLKEKDTLQMALRPAVELSYLPENEQNALLEVMESEDCTPSHDQAIRIRDLSENSMLTPKAIKSIMQEEKPNQVEQFKIPREPYRQVFPCGDARTEDRGHHREGFGDVPQAGKGEGAMRMGPTQNRRFCGERRSKGAGAVFAFRRKRSRADFATTTPGGQSALLRPWHFPRPPPLTLSPSKPAVPAERKALPILFSAGKTLWREARQRTNHQTPGSV